MQKGKLLCPSNTEHLSTARGTCPLGCWLAILHRYGLGILYLLLGATFYTIRLHLVYLPFLLKNRLFPTTKSIPLAVAQNGQLFVTSNDCSPGVPQHIAVYCYRRLLTQTLLPIADAFSATHGVPCHLVNPTSSIVEWQLPRSLHY